MSIGAPVIFGENVAWVDPQSKNDKEAEILNKLEAWRQDWESLNSDRYLAHYAPDFKTQKHDAKSWSNYKRSVNSRKNYIQIVIDDPAIYGYPGEQDLVQVDFVQHYNSDNYKGKALKRQYWQKQSGGDWQITYEGTLQRL